MKNASVKCISAWTVVVLIIIYIRCFHYPDPRSMQSSFHLLQDKDFMPFNQTETKAREIIILRWTQYFGEYYYESPMIFRKGEKCPKSIDSETLKADCRLSYDRRYLERSHAVIFHLWDLLNGDRISNELPPYHNPDQIWIMQNHESANNPNIRHSWPFKGFNWTMTYRWDSDFHDPYGLVKAERTDYDYEYLRHSSENKTKLVAWIVSHCKTPGKREEFVKHLRKYIPVDIYGQCGTHKCNRSTDGCYSDVAQEYKFYLSFENSLCVDYVTEKFFNALAHNLVPVVYGGANYSKIAPPGSFIYAGDFRSPRELADYLMRLDSNLEEYLTYFRWKRNFRVERGLGNWCGLCQKVYNELFLGGNHIDTDGAQRRKLYANIDDWWNHQIISGVKVPACDKPAVESWE